METIATVRTRLVDLLSGSVKYDVSWQKVKFITRPPSPEAIRVDPVPICHRAIRFVDCRRELSAQERVDLDHGYCKPCEPDPIEPVAAVALPVVLPQAPPQGPVKKIRQPRKQSFATSKGKNTQGKKYRKSSSDKDVAHTRAEIPEPPPASPEMVQAQNLDHREIDRDVSSPDQEGGIFCPELRRYVFLCQYCSKSTFTSGDLKIHMKYFHGESVSRKVKCPTCSAPFHNQSFLRQHQQSAHGRSDKESDKEVEKRWACTPCDRTFSSAAGLASHNRAAHATKSGHQRSEQADLLSSNDSDSTMVESDLTSVSEVFFVGGEDCDYFTADVSQYSAMDPATIIAAAGKQPKAEGPSSMCSSASSVSLVEQDVKLEPVESVHESQSLQIIQQKLATCAICGPNSRLFSSWTSWCRHLATHGIISRPEDEAAFQSIIYGQH